MAIALEAKMPTRTGKSPRVQVVLSDRRMRLLHAYAAKQGSKPTTEAALLLSNLLDQMESDGLIDLNEISSDSTGNEETEGDIVADIMTKIMKAIAEGKSPDTKDLDIVANYMGLTLRETESLIEKMARNGNGKKTSVR